MFDVKETRLLQHPTVEKAYQVMRTFFADDKSGDAFAREAIRGGELISRFAAKPDPDAIAAAVLMDGMIIRYDAQQFAQSVSPKAADYLQKFYDLDIENPVFTTEAERQILLAASIKGLDHINGVIAAPDFYDAENEMYQDYRRVKQILDANEVSLQKILPHTEETAMAEFALESFIRAKEALNEKVATAQAELAFENTGLPAHPFVRAVYEYMLADNLERHPMGGYVDTNRDIAKLLVETGATQDPEVIGAALLNQHYCEDQSVLAEKFSPRLLELFQASSPWARMGTEKETEALSADAQVWGKTITHAHHLNFLEGNITHYPLYKERMEEHSLSRWLEDLESLHDKVKKGAAEESSPALQKRMEQAVHAAHWLMYVPENKAIRAPGSPKIDHGW